MDGIEIKAVDDISLSINEGELVAIMGPSGCGKSTLMHIIGLLDKPTCGEVFLEERAISGLPENELAQLRNKRIGFVFQFFNLLPRMTAIANVELTLTYSGIDQRQRQQKAIELLQKLNLKDRINHFPSQLSGGQQQKVAIARALINNPILILADEPTGNLDSKSSLEIINIFQNLNNDGHTILIITHEQEIAKYTKRVIKMRDGRIVK
jgi:putative ABC transport system ATP-binding protein